MISDIYLARRTFVGGQRQSRAAAGDYWNRSADQIGNQLGTGTSGLTAAEAQRRLHKFGPNQLRAARTMSHLDILLRQFANPLLWLLLFAAIIAALTSS